MRLIDLLVTKTPRTTVSRGTALAVMVGGLALGALLNAEPLADTAAAEPTGWQRDVAIAATDALNDVSDALGFDEPHDALDSVLGKGDETDNQPVAPGDVFIPTPDRPARLWIAGDSLIESIGPAVVNAAAGTGVVQARYDVQYSSGLTRPELYDWPSNLVAGVGAEPADIVVFMVGANDGQAIETAAGFATFGSEEWTSEYTVRVATVMDSLAERVTSVFWIGLPVTSDDRLSDRFAAMNALYRAEATRRDTVTYIDIFTSFAGPEGEYAPLLPDAEGRLVRARDPDGVHFTPDGADLVATRVVDIIGDTWELPGH